MGGDVPKQFLPIGGRPVLMHTLQRFRDYSPNLQIILVLPREQHDYWRQLCRTYQYPLPSEEEGSYRLADGGETRFHSVQNGLKLIPDDACGVVGVHDGVRPFVSLDVIRRCYGEAHVQKAVVPVVPVVETVRRISTSSTDASVTVPREQYRLVQTPQVFDIHLLKTAYRQTYRDDFTDDASVVEAAGHAVTLVEGNRENIKLTTPFDLAVAEALL